MENIIELKENELIEISGGYNLLEYIAMGVGYVHGTMASINDHLSTSPVHNNWLYK